jgi:hypothetical protein
MVQERKRRRVHVLVDLLAALAAETLAAGSLACLFMALLQQVAYADGALQGQWQSAGVSQMPHELGAARLHLSELPIHLGRFRGGEGLSWEVSVRQVNSRWNKIWKRCRLECKPLTCWQRPGWFLLSLPLHMVHINGEETSQTSPSPQNLASDVGARTACQQVIMSIVDHAYHKGADRPKID